VRESVNVGEADLAAIFRALSFAAEKHRDQRRKDDHGSPYINHPIALARVLCEEAGVTDAEVLCAALLHDTLEDTDAKPEELETHFGPAIRGIVMEVTDDKDLPKAERKRLQIAHAPGATRQAKLVKLADKICNLRDVALNPPVGWDLERRRAYFDWAKDVVAGIRGTHPRLEALFDEAYCRRPGDEDGARQRPDGS
jgi:GTP diphosphokinase / guanosine-3',5'-bis(diphosphate) 3'-diphosphatase